jgi:hypothetical protein
MEKQKNAPYAVAAMVLGICSLLFGCFFVGLVLGIVGLVLANKGLNVCNRNPDTYTGEGMLKTGKVTSILGIIFGSIYIFYYVIAVVIIGSAGLVWLDWLNIF